jgi:hypothetical protein
MNAILNVLRSLMCRRPARVRRPRRFIPIRWEGGLDEDVAVGRAPVAARKPAPASAKAGRPAGETRPSSYSRQPRGERALAAG